MTLRDQGSRSETATSPLPSAVAHSSPARIRAWSRWSNSKNPGPFSWATSGTASAAGAVAVGVGTCQPVRLTVPPAFDPAPAPAAAAAEAVAGARTAVIVRTTVVGTRVRDEAVRWAGGRGVALLGCRGWSVGAGPGSATGATSIARAVIAAMAASASGVASVA